MIISINTQLGTGIQVEPRKYANNEAVTSQMPCPILGRNSRIPARIPMANAKGNPRRVPMAIKMSATMVLNNS